MRKTGNYRWEDEKVEEKEVKVKQVSEREIWVGENRFYLGEDNIIYAEEVMRPDDKIALAEKDAILKLANLLEGKVDFTVDLNESGAPSAQARNIYQSLVEHEKIGKVAMFGLHPVASVMSAFLIGVTQKKDIRFFKTKEEALTWLKE